MNPVIVEADMVTPYGRGCSACWKGLVAGRSAIRSTDKFGASRFLSDKAALVPNVESGHRSRVMGLLAPLLRHMETLTPPDAAVVLATTTGEIDLLEGHVLAGSPESDASHPRDLLESVRGMIGNPVQHQNLIGAQMQ